jgi:large subunit ribosomal protein L7A
MVTKMPGKRVVGAKQTLKAVKSGLASVVYVARDADLKVTVPIAEACNQNGVELIFVETMEELGRLCSIDVGAATACIVKD